MVWLAQANCYLKVVKSNKPNNADRLEPKGKAVGHFCEFWECTNIRTAG